MRQEPRSAGEATERSFCVREEEEILRRDLHSAGYRFREVGDVAVRPRSPPRRAEGSLCVAVGVHRKHGTTTGKKAAVSLRVDPGSRKGPKQFTAEELDLFHGVVAG